MLQASVYADVIAPGENGQAEVAPCALHALVSEARTPNQVDQLGAFSELIHAIGTPRFENVLFETICQFADVDHYGIVTFAAEETPHYVGGYGTIGKEAFAEVTRCYEAELFRLDPNVPKIMERRGNQTLAFHEFRNGEGYPPFYRRKVLDPVAITDKHAFSFWRDRTGYYVNLYRTHDRGFSAETRLSLNRLAGILAAPISRHFSSLPRIPQGASNFLERVLGASPSFKGTTARERAVCLGILRGHTSESIGLHLGISRNTVLTYRKRLYEKLAICSQHELFMMFIKSAQTFDRPSNTTEVATFVIDAAIEWVDGFV